MSTALTTQQSLAVAPIGSGGSLLQILLADVPTLRTMSQRADFCTQDCAVLTSVAYGVALFGASNSTFEACAGHTQLLVQQLPHIRVSEVAEMFTLAAAGKLQYEANEAIVDKEATVLLKRLDIQCYGKVLTGQQLLQICSAYELYRRPVVGKAKSIKERGLEPDKQTQAEQAAAAKVKLANEMRADWERIQKGELKIAGLYDLVGFECDFWIEQYPEAFPQSAKQAAWNEAKAATVADMNAAHQHDGLIPRWAIEKAAIVGYDTTFYRVSFNDLLKMQAGQMQAYEIGDGVQMTKEQITAQIELQRPLTKLYAQKLCVWRVLQKKN